MDIEIFEETQPGSCTSEFFEVHASSVTCGISYLVSNTHAKEMLNKVHMGTCLPPPYDRHRPHVISFPNTDFFFRFFFCQQ